VRGQLIKARAISSKTGRIYGSNLDLLFRLKSLQNGRRPYTEKQSAFRQYGNAGCCKNVGWHRGAAYPTYGLKSCTNVKVKRLFLWLAQRQGHAWFNGLTPLDYNLGAGKRVVAVEGRLDNTWLITVPKDSLINS
jgi:hypothetical protein